ncbi:MAG: hypothetical protein QM704_13370 [Anaeromyxobacteraceae bacterium]
MNLRPLAAALALAPSPSLAQAFDGTQALDAFTGPAATEGRIIGLGGAVVGLGEGVGAAMFNPAAVAHRRRDLDRGWDLGGTLTYYLPIARDLGHTDLGNDGRADTALEAEQNAQLGGMVQVGRFGFGVVATVWQAAVRRGGGDAVQVATSDVSFMAGWAFLRDELILGAASTVGAGEVKWFGPGVPLTATVPSVRYEGPRLRFGALVRPRGEPWRFGLAWDPGAIAEVRGDRALVPVQTPASFRFPWTLSFGGALWLGPNARHLNEPPVKVAHPEGWGPAPAYEPSRHPPVLVTAQLDLVGPSPDAVTIESALFPDRPAVRSGVQGSIVPRVGVEWEAWRRWIRGRAGSYLEPSRSGAGPRLHGAGGFEVRIPCWPWDLQAGAYADVARLYRNVTVSLGFWNETAPLPPAGAGAPAP